MKLIPEWKAAHRFWSMRWIIATTVFSSATVAYASLPADWVASVPPGMRTFLAVGTLVSAVGAGVARVLSQPPIVPQHELVVLEEAHYKSTDRTWAPPAGPRRTLAPEQMRDLTTPSPFNPLSQDSER